MELVNEVKSQLDATLPIRPDAYNIGFNAGSAAGQTVPHVHIHVIPRYTGDVRDPRGGVRHVIPSKGNYLASESASEGARDSPVLSTGHPYSPLWKQLACRLTMAESVDILVSFVQISGLELVGSPLFAVLRNQGTVRVLVGDYLYISDPKALRLLHGWNVAAAEEFGPGRFEARLVELKKLPEKPRSFHPKAWRIRDDTGGWLVVGSSNLSRAALMDGVEWNLLSPAGKDSAVQKQADVEFTRLWEIASPLTNALLTSYDEAAGAFRQPYASSDVPEVREQLPEPRFWQTEALAALARIRSLGYRRALVAVATGMGKTWLAGFDIRALSHELNRPPRVLVLAHRAHILVQAERVLIRTLEAEFPSCTTSWFLSGENDLNGGLVLASVQKLSRPDGLAQLALQKFDYALVDEVHHAQAPSYRRILAVLQSDFILGLTATPERADGVDVASIFDDNLAYEAGIGDGINEGALVPFHYIGLRDTVDFQQIPWRNGKFDSELLDEAVLRSERMARLALALRSNPGERTLFFCCSQRHAVFTRNWLRALGFTAACVFSGEGSDPCADSLEGLETGKLSALCVVDMFNEGLDIPAVDRVVMLRPTGSKVVFLQQLGRGLRASEGKTHLKVIDFVGNHRVFTQRVIHLLSLTRASAGMPELRKWLSGAEPALPPGCLLNVELEAKDVLRHLLPSGNLAVRDEYRALREDLGRRPLMVELFHRGVLPRTLSAAHDGWCGFVESEGDFNQIEAATAGLLRQWFSVVESTSLNKSYKMVLLRVLLDLGGFWSGIELLTLSIACRRFLLGHPVLRLELEGAGHALDHFNATDREWADWWIEWPVGRLLAEKGGKKWFVREGDRLRFAVECPMEMRETAEFLTAEIVDYRIAHYSKSRGLVPGSAAAGEVGAFTTKVSHAGGKPILFLPDRLQNPGLPTGPTLVTLPGGGRWEFKFVKVACNVARPEGGNDNQLPVLIRKWFGEKAGLPGTNFTVKFTNEAGEWCAVPETYGQIASSVDVRAVEGSSAQPLIFETAAPLIENNGGFPTHVPVFDLEAAAGGWGPDGSPRPIGWHRLANGEAREGMFMARVVGRSMEPRIPSGSWGLFRPCPVGTREGRLVLVQLNLHTDPEDGGCYTIKRYHSVKRTTEGGGWEHNLIELQPLNAAYSTISVSPEQARDLRIVGEFVRVVG
jgi:superfamily II DNA or RNA helicase/HKD family nuclease